MHTAHDRGLDLREIRHFHLFCGLGGGARGFNRGTARVGNMQAVFRCIGGIDVSPAAIHDFNRLAGVPGTILDLFDAEQYTAFHGHAPPAGWRPATPADLQRAAGGERPHIVFLSAPCKGFSGLLAEEVSRSPKYQALNRLTLRGIWLVLEAWQDDPPELVVFENVPRIATRGRALLDQIGALLRHYGYAIAETTHDCGKLGGLAQTRKRFLLVARHQEKVPPFLYEPEQHRLRAVGEVLEKLPLPGDIARGGPMHRIPLLQWQTWVRLAFVEAGSDWRSLNRLRVHDGYLTDFRLVPERDWHSGVLGVQTWHEPACTVTGNARSGTGAYSVADPRRTDGVAAFGHYGVRTWSETSQVLIGKAAVGDGHFAVADPRHSGPEKFNNIYRVIAWDRHATTVTSNRDVAVADPRTHAPMHAPTNDSMRVADPRPNLKRETGDNWTNAGHYGIVKWTSSASTISGAAGHDNGWFNIADPREPQTPPNATETRLPAAQQRLLAVIRSLDGTWHRPFTTLELAALQSLVDPEAQLELDGLSEAAWRERVGNAVPPDAAQAIANTMGTTLLLAWSGETFLLSAMPIWVRPIAAGLSVNSARP